jgi:hypothetical protein
LSGSGSVDDAEIATHSAVQLDGGEQGRIVSKDTLELLVFGLPTIVAEAAGSGAASGKAEQQHA